MTPAAAEPEQPQGPRMSPERMSLAAIVLALVGSTGGGIMNVSSNNAVASKLEALTLTLVKVEGRLDSGGADLARVQAEVTVLRADLKEERQKLEILERDVLLLKNSPR